MSINIKLLIWLLVLSAYSLCQDIPHAAINWINGAKLKKGQTIIARIVVLPHGSNDLLLFEIIENYNNCEIKYDKISKNKLNTESEILLEQGIFDEKKRSTILNKFRKASIPILPETGMLIHQDEVVMIVVSKFDRKHWISGDLPTYNELEKLLISIIPKEMQTFQMQRWDK